MALHYRTDAYRTVYALRIGERLWVVHAFQKKAKQGIKTPTKEIDLIRERLKRFLTQMCARFSPSRSAAPWEEGADALVPANQRCSRLSLSRRPPARAQLLVEGLLGGSQSHRKVLRRWHLQGDEP